MIKYEELQLDEFDAVVTGELTHLAIHLEGELDNIIIDVFQVCKVQEFRKLILHREGLKFQDKIEIVRCCIPMLEKVVDPAELKKTLNEVEAFKAWRNALSHGHDVGSTSEPLKMRVEIINRAGKEKIVEITPESHQVMLDEIDVVLVRLQKFAEVINKFEE